MKIQYYVHIPSQLVCHKKTYFEHEYVVFEDTNEMKPMTKSGLYSNYTLKEIV